MRLNKLRTMRFIKDFKNHHITLYKLPCNIINYINYINYTKLYYKLASYKIRYQQTALAIKKCCKLNISTLDYITDTVKTEIIAKPILSYLHATTY